MGKVKCPRCGSQDIDKNIGSKILGMIIDIGVAIVSNQKVPTDAYGNASKEDYTCCACGHKFKPK